MIHHGSNAQLYVIKKTGRETIFAKCITLMFRAMVILLEVYNIVLKHHLTTVDEPL